MSIPLIQRVRTINLFLFIGISVLLSEILTSIMSIILRGKITSDYLITGAVVSLIVSAIVVYFVKQVSRLSDDNENLLKEIINREKIENALQDSEKFLQTIIETGPECIELLAADSSLLQINRAGLAMIQADSLAQVKGQRVCDLVVPEHRAAFDSLTDRVFRGESLTLDFEAVGLKGRHIWLETHAVPFRNDKGETVALLGITRDITEGKHMEKLLREEKYLLEEERLKTQKLEAIGTLAGGIAHDFNNLLQGVFGYISMSKVAHDDKERSLAMLEQAEKALHLSVNLTTQLLTFSKGGSPVKKKIPLQPVIENSVRFALSGSSADYQINVDTDLWHVDADEGQVGQVIQNIVLNADQAMPTGGTIVISAKNVREPKMGSSQLPDEGKYVEIAVQDNGTGISGEYLSKIFDPYFTTKAKGSGLGLATCYSIIKNHDGVIHVSSKVGKGTTFYIYLPAIEAEKETPQIAEHSPFIGRGRILLMDDEELIRNIARDMIKALDHEVELAERGEEAIEKYKAAMESGNPFDVVVLDLTIRGGMGGRETIERLLEVNPKVRAIVSSGYSDDAVVSDYRNYGFSACLSKPYKLQELSDTLNNLLNKGRLPLP